MYLQMTIVELFTNTSLFLCMTLINAYNTYLIYIKIVNTFSRVKQLNVLYRIPGMQTHFLRCARCLRYQGNWHLRGHTITSCQGRWCANSDGSVAWGRWCDAVTVTIITSLVTCKGTCMDTLPSLRYALRSWIIQ